MPSSSSARGNPRVALSSRSVPRTRARFIPLVSEIEEFHLPPRLLLSENGPYPTDPSVPCRTLHRQFKLHPRDDVRRSAQHAPAVRLLIDGCFEHSCYCLL